MADYPFCSRYRQQTFVCDFSLPPGLREDPFTGGYGWDAAYLWRYSLIASPLCIIQQRGWLESPGQVTVEVINLRDEDAETINVGGGTAIIVQGELVL